MAELDSQRRKVLSQIARHPGISSDSRITIRETADGLGIDNPGHRRMPIILFLLLWLGGWGVGEIFALREIFGGGGPLSADLFLIIWVTFWTIGGAAVWVFVLWQLFGVERLFITSGALVREIGLWRIRRRQVFDLAQVSDFKLSSAPAAPNSTNRAISFKVAGEDQSFGVSMSREEATASLAAIRRHLPSAEPLAGDERSEEDVGVNAS
ncbi:MAG: hypothetical protein Rhirs2KO_09000 [Rhizobiaceae bacterium]